MSILVRPIVRPATLGDYQALCALFEELDEFHRQARPDFFRPFDRPARTWEQAGRWLAGPHSTVLLADDGAEVIGLSLLLPRFAAAVRRCRAAQGGGDRQSRGPCG